MGRIAEIQLEALSGLPAFSVVAICDPDPSRAAAGPAGAVFFSSLTECLAVTPCDAVLVSTPTHTHVDVAREVIAAGRHLLLEKPAVVNPGEMTALQSLAAEAGILFQTALHMARGAETDWLAGHLDELRRRGEAAPVIRFESTFHDPLYIGGCLHPRAPSVLGSWVDSGINALSVLSRFVPLESLAVATSSFRHIPGLPVRDVHACVHFVGANSKGRIQTDWTVDSSAKTTVLHLADGSQWCLDHNTETATLTGPRETVHACHRHPDRMVDHYRGVFRDFADALTGGKSNTVISLTLHRLLIDAPAGVL